MQFPFSILIILLLPCCSLSNDENYEDVLLGPLRPTNNNFPFLQPIHSTAKVLVFPNRQQMVSLVSDSLASKGNWDKKFEGFETLRKYLRNYLMGAYRQSSKNNVRPPSIEIEKEAYNFTAFIVVTKQLINLIRDMEAIDSPTHFPKSKVIEQVRTCKSETLGDTGVSDDKQLDNGFTEFQRSRINCIHIEDKIFIAVGTIHLKYRKNRSANSLESQSVEMYADDELRRSVKKNFDYPYLLESSDQYWTATPTPPIMLRPGIKNNAVQTFQGGLANGSYIIVQGTPVADFNVNLMQDDEWINLHIGVRFHEKVVVLNSYLKSNTKDMWLIEERYVAIPFKINELFKLKISREDTGYQVSVNGKNFAFYRHRLCPDMVRFVTVAGDVKNVIVADSF